MSTTSTESRPAQSRPRGIDVLIAAVLILFAFDTLPCTPDSVRAAIRPLLHVTGLWQGTWSLFAPTPDSTNHRIRADFYYPDGSHQAWESPDWRSQSAWQRFAGHRQSEYFEKIIDDDSSPAWPAFAHDLIRQVSPDRGPERVELTVISGDIPPPRDAWKMTPVPLNHERKFFTLFIPD